MVLLHALRKHMVESWDISHMPSHKRFAMDVLQTLRIKIDSRVIDAYGAVLVEYLNIIPTVHVLFLL